MYISNPSNQKGSTTYSKDDPNQHGYPLRYPDNNANFMQGSRQPSMGSVSSQNQNTAENVQFAATSSGYRKDALQEGTNQESHSDITHESRAEDDRVNRSWGTYERPPPERVTDEKLSPHVGASNGRHHGSRAMSPAEGSTPRSYSATPPALYGTNAPPHITGHSILQYTSPPMVQYSTVPGLQTYAPYYSPFVRLPSHPTVVRTAPHEVESSYSEMLANIGNQVRGQPLLPHSLLPTTVHTHFGTIDGSPLPSPREYPPGFAIPGGGIYVVGVQSDSRSSSRHPSGEQRQSADKESEHTHPHPARERWESHERKYNDSKNILEEETGSRGTSPRELHPVTHHVRFRDPPYQTEIGHERSVYHESPKVAHVHPLEPVQREERYTRHLPSANVHPLYANALTIQTSLQSPPQLVSPPATYSSMQLQLSPTPQVRPSTHATPSQNSSVEQQQGVFSPSHMKESPKTNVIKESRQGSESTHQPVMHKLTADAEYPGSSTFPSYFTRGSVIRLASGDLKRVEDLCTEDFIQSAQVTEGLNIDSSTVVRIENSLKKPVAIISFSVGELREQVTVEATSEHPFYVFGHGWSSVKPELTMLRYNLTCHKLAVGDVCISLTPKDKQRVEEQPESVARTYRSEYLDNKRQRLKYRKNPSDHRDNEHTSDTIAVSEQRQHTKTDTPMEHWYHPSGASIDKRNLLASELKSLNVSNPSSARSSTHGMSNVRTSNTPSRSDAKSCGIKGKHSYQTLEEVKEEEEETMEPVKQKTSHYNTMPENVDNVAKYTIAR